MYGLTGRCFRVLGCGLRGLWDLEPPVAAFLVLSFRVLIEFLSGFSTPRPRTIKRDLENRNPKLNLSPGPEQYFKIDLNLVKTELSAFFFARGGSVV